jgi:hypothetical protein
MNMSHRVHLFAVLLCLSLSPRLDAGLLFEQVPSIYNGCISDTAIVNNIWQICADNFRFTTDQPVAHVTWWGFYGGSFGANITPPTVDENLRLRFYDARPSDGSPGNVLYEVYLLNPQRIATGRYATFPGQPAEYRFDVNLQTIFSALGNTMYWMEIIQVGLNDSMFRWSFSTTQLEGLDGAAFVNVDVPDWQIVPTNLAFQLYDVPEPSTIALSVITGLFILSGRRRANRSTLHINCGMIGCVESGGTRAEAGPWAETT